MDGITRGIRWLIAGTAFVAAMALAGSPAQAAEISAARAKSIALAKTKGGKVVKCKRDREDGRIVYEIEIHTSTREYDIDVDAKTGKIRKIEVEARKKTPTLNAVKLTATQAKKIALARTGKKSARVVKCKLDVERGRRVYEIEIKYGRYEYSMNVDATTGKITEYEVDRD